MADVMQHTPQPVTPIAHMSMHPPSTPTSSQDATSKMPPPSMIMNSASRRPPRKSTLTQQQKNQKRQRATQDQLMTLEVEFNKNPTPTAPVRDRIAHEINMTERSVQIWFQNRRAKIKNIAKRSIESGEDCDSIPESMRNYLAMQAYGPNKAPGIFARGPGYFPYPHGQMGFSADASAGKTVIQHFHCRSLAIGTWRRVGQNSMDLVVFYSPERACITYYIHNEQSGYKIEYPFAWIKTITLEQSDVVTPAEGASQGSGGLIVELNKPPKFYMDSSGSGGFYECGDFTEDRQASKVMLHHLGGPSKVLSGQLAKLISLDAYQNRHAFDPSAFAVVSAPVSPIGHRPASQPNHMVHPHHQMSLFPHPPDPNMGLMGPPGPRGHKRQRSRSVPVAIDFSMIRQPMPSFLIQHDGAPAPHHDPHIFAPQPQHQHSNPHAFVQPPMQGLHIDTSPAPFGMDLRPYPPPMSATTLNSPSEFGTPGFFNTTGENMPAPMLATTFNNFLSVDPSVMLGTSHTPLSATSHGDPVIADQSPPLSGMGRSQSAGDVFTTDDHPNFGDDGAYLSETFNKQINLPFRSPMPDDQFPSPIADGTMTFDFPPPGPDGTVHFGTSPQEQAHDGTTISFDSPDPAAHQANHHHHQQQQQHHQDSGVSFSSTPHELENGSILYNDTKVFHSPAQVQHMQQSQDEQAQFQSPMYHQQHPHQDFDMMGFVNPSSLGNQRQQHV